MSSRGPATTETPGAGDASAATRASDVGVQIRARVDHGGFTLDVDLELPGCGVSAIFGPSGCGKTTLLRAAAGLVRPLPGRIAMAGGVWQDDAAGVWVPTHRRPLGMVFQDAALFDHLSVQANLDFGSKRVPPGQRRVSLEQAIALLGIGELLGRRPAQLSGGERQRVAIARALATSPRLLLMDEPLASLDAPRKAELLPYFERLARELDIPMLYVTHSLDEVARLAQHLVLLESGRLRTQGPADILLARLDVAKTHGDAASAVVDGIVAVPDDGSGLLQVDFVGGRLQCLHTPGSPVRMPGDRLRLRILARDVSITLSRASDTSILNVLPATVVALADDGAAQVLVSLRVGATPMLARITRKSAHQLELAAGKPVYAQIKGVALLD